MLFRSNACTGERGLHDSLKATAELAARLGVDPEEVLICSTGVIGVPIPMDILEAGLSPLIAALSDQGGADAARAILTTDLIDKQIALEADLGGRRVRIGGMAKGSGMIHPDMATMLGFLSCDAGVAPDTWQALVRRAVDRSFNAITVDGDTSTSDTLLLFATGKGARHNPVTRANDKRLDDFRAKLNAVLQDLAVQVVKDGEGATKLIRIKDRKSTRLNSSHSSVSRMPSSA